MKEKLKIHHLCFFLFFGFVIETFSTQVMADDLDTIARLGMDGAPMLAIERVDRYIEQHPNETQAQLLKGMLLSMANKKAEAIKLFSGLMAKHPEIPAAGNNLAVVYASQHEYDKAIKLLQSVIKQHPDYLNAQKNLGDIYTELATNTYAKVYDANAMDGQTKAKYEALKQLQAVNDKSSNNTTAPSAAPSDPVKTSAPPNSTTSVIASVSKPALVAPSKSTIASSVANVAQSPITLTSTSTNSTATTDSNKSSKPESAAGKAAQNPAVKIGTPVDPSEKIKELGQVLNGWAAAWAQQNVQLYLNYYADTFRAPDGQTLEAWKQLRQERIKKPRMINVEVSDPVFSINVNTATAVFTQHYVADNKTFHDKKRLDFVLVGGKWLIESEKVINP